MDTVDVNVRIDGPLGSVILQRPATRNALTCAMLEQIDQALEDLHQQRRVRAVTITHKGAYFSAGTDLAELQATRADSLAPFAPQLDLDVFRDLLMRMLEYPKPIIAALAGPALGHGLGLVLASDLVIASHLADIGLPEARRGLVAGMIIPLLAFRAGTAVAAQLALTGQSLTADEAYRWGIVHEIVPEELLWVRAGEIASQVAQCAPEAVLLSRRMLNETVGEHLRTMLAAGAATTATARTTESAEQGIVAFLKKQSIDWLG